MRRTNRFLCACVMIFTCIAIHAEDAKKMLDLQLWGGFGADLNMEYAGNLLLGYGGAEKDSYLSRGPWVIDPGMANYRGVLPMRGLPVNFGLYAGWLITQSTSAGIIYSGDLFLNRAAGDEFTDYTREFARTTSTTTENGTVTVETTDRLTENFSSDDQYEFSSFDLERQTIFLNSVFVSVKHRSARIWKLNLINQFGVGVALPWTDHSRVSWSYDILQRLSTDFTKLDPGSREAVTGSAVSSIRYDWGIACTGMAGVEYPVNDMIGITLGIRGIFAVSRAQSFSVSYEDTVSAGGQTTDVSITAEGVFAETESDQWYAEKTTETTDSGGNTTTVIEYSDGAKIVRSVSANSGGTAVTGEYAGLRALPYNRALAGLSLVLMVNIRI